MSKEIETRVLTEQEIQAKRRDGETIDLAINTTLVNEALLTNFGKLAQFQADMAPIVATANSLEVNEAGDVIEAKTLLGELSWRNKRLDAGRRAMATAFRKKVDDHINPILLPMQEAEQHLRNGVRAWKAEQDRIEMEKRRKAEAEAERRRKLQQAAVARGGTARTEIVAAPVAPVAMPVPGITMRLEYTVTDVEKLPDEFVVKSADRAAIRKRVLDIQASIAKDARKGDIEQSIPGVELKWVADIR